MKFNPFKSNLLKYNNLWKQNKKQINKQTNRNNSYTVYLVSRWFSRKFRYPILYLMYYFWNNIVQMNLLLHLKAKEVNYRCTLYNILYLKHGNLHSQYIRTLRPKIKHLNIFLQSKINVTILTSCLAWYIFNMRAKSVYWRREIFL